MTNPARILQELLDCVVSVTNVTHVSIPIKVEENGLLIIRVQLIISECTETRDKLENVARTIYDKLKEDALKAVFETVMEDQDATTMKNVEGSAVPLLYRDVFVRYMPINVDDAYPVLDMAVPASTFPALDQF